MIQKLFLLLHIYLIIQKTLADDPIVSKEESPAGIRCQRTKGQVAVEKQQANTNYYQSCYDYEIDVNDECNLMPNPDVYDLNSFTLGSDTIYTVDTPLDSSSLVYPNDKICYFEIGKRKQGFVYQYYFPALYQQDIEGSLIIDDDGITAEVTGGLCPDFFEFREKQYDKSIPTNKLVTCGNITDPRIQFAVDVASKLTLVFKSNQQKGFNGLNLSVLEYMPSAGGSKRKKKDIEAPQGLQGALGDKGERGAPGEPGSTGNPGRDGSKGAKGETGIPGVIGPEGDIGLPGENGIPGDIGPTGLKGKSCTCPSFGSCEPGNPGRKGAKGFRGVHGDIGPRGFRGLPGIPGPIGLAGDKGRKGNKGSNGVRGLPGPRGDQGLPGIRGRTGPPGPPGLGGCPLPSHKKLARHIREVGHIFSTITELYKNLGLENQMSADEFYDYIMKKPSIEKDTVSDHLYSDEIRVARSAESSTDCNGVPVIPGPVGDQGVPGLPGDDGVNGESGLPGVDGTTGKAGDPGTPGLQGSQGSRGIRGPRGQKGDKGVIGAPGDSGYCHCYQGKGKAKVGKITFLQKAGNGMPGKSGARGRHGQKGHPGSVGEKGLPGIRGKRGPKGLKGVDGVPGRTGFNGNQGDKGQRGQRGVRGPTGPPGPPGPPGCVCNNLVILLDEYGFVKSSKIPDLTKLEDDRNGSKQENTSTEFFFKPNVTCIRNDSGAAIIGPKGERGLPGFPGATGNPGIPGLRGEDGIPGIKGRHGDPGLPGNNGKRGLQGEIGKKGGTGINGIQGPPGKNTTCILGKESDNLIAIQCPRGCPNGLDGAVGDKGDTGLKGLSGFRGVRGLRGSPGPWGAAGSPGSPGDEGSAGMPGVKGPPGLRGLPGAIGPAGPAGLPGPRDSCPEYDGVDFDMLLSASKEDINMIEYLINTPNIEVATNMTNREFPLLRTLAKLITGGYEFPKFNPTTCPELKSFANGGMKFRRNGIRYRAVFYCDEGFTLKGRRTLVCNHGKWSSSPPVCIKQ